MNLVVLDLIFLGLFIITASIFLYAKKRNLKKEGALFLYKTSWGIKLIDYVGTKYKRSLKVLSYISIITGYILMTGIILLMIQTVYLYLTSDIAKTIKAPPIAPLIPYFPKLFGLQSFFPPFYFVYFIVAILIVATAHEFAHGIFARGYNIKIKSTGFAFLKYFPALFGAFVEQDESQMNKAKKFEQMSVLSAGVFANILVGILFYIILFNFFTFAFIPSGVQFTTYSFSVVNTNEISSINNISVSSYEELVALSKENGLNKIIVGDKNYVAEKEVLEKQIDNEGQIILYDDAPAINAQIGNIITEFEGVKIDSLETLQKELEKKNVGDEISIVTKTNGEMENYEIALGENPQDENRAWLGVGFYSSGGKISEIISKVFPSYKKENVYYEPKNDFSVFIKDLLWWVFIINVLVAFFNMLPLGILDGGRFFYLTILGLTKSDKIAKKSFKIVTSLIIVLFAVLMIKWLLTWF